LKSLEEENRRLKSVVADLSLDKQILQDVVSKISETCSSSSAYGSPGGDSH
jgi:putative transposase